MKIQSIILARFLLIVGTFITFLCNDTNVLFPDLSFTRFKPVWVLDHFNIFYLSGPEYITHTKILCTLLLGLALSTRYIFFTTCCHWYISYCFFRFAPLVEGGDQITLILSFFLIPLMFWYQKNDHIETHTFTHSIYFLMKLQVAVVYFVAGVGKFQVEEWINGTIYYYWFNSPLYGAPEIFRELLNPLLLDSIVIFCISWGTMLFEIFLSTSILWGERMGSKLVKILLCGLSFHFLILLFHGLVSFFFAMAGALVILLLPMNYKINLKQPYLFQYLYRKRHSNI